MSQLPLGSLFRIILSGRSSFKFLFGIILSFAFSISVILATIGLMDGFDKTLKSKLGKSNGDIIYSSENGFFEASDQMFEHFSFVKSYSNILQVESFAIVTDQSTGVLLNGIDVDAFSNTTGLKINELQEGVAIGSKFSQKHKLKLGDEITIAFASKKSKHQGSAILRSFEISQIVNHGIHEKDMRLIYIRKDQLSEILDYKRSVANYGVLKLFPGNDIEQSRKKLSLEFYDDFNFRSFWSEYDQLIEAVEQEKFSISLVLQLIVVVAIINVLAFVIFVFEIKSQDIFMLRALGLSFKSFRRFWIYTLMFIWAASCIISLGFIYVFENFILTIPALQIPGDVYVLSKLTIMLDALDYTYVFGVSLVWILLIGFVTIQRIRKNTIVSGLRQEFS